MLTFGVAAVLATMMWHPHPAAARPAPPPAKAPDASLLDRYVEQAWDLVGPVVSRLGFSGLLGMAAASALKVTVGRPPPATSAAASRR
jgi:hypothetical protein